MYDWDNMSKNERRAVLNARYKNCYPPHELPHFDNVRTSCFSITASNFRHRKILGKNSSRLDDFLKRLRQAIQDREDVILHGWCLMLNHYHLLVSSACSKELRKVLGKLHGRTSREWNLEDNTVGRQVWFRVFDRPIYSQRQFHCTMNYIHANPVKAGLCRKIDEWPWSSGRDFLRKVGRSEAVQLWKAYPPAESSLVPYDEGARQGLKAAFTHRQTSAPWPPV